MSDGTSGITLEQLIETTKSSTESDFYKNLWGKETEFEAFPVCTRKDLILTPLSKRAYKLDRGLVKIVHDGNAAFLSKWCFTDTGTEKYGVKTERPMVYFDSSHETLEKAMWCYENKMLPLVGEKNTAVAMAAAEQYDIDSLIVDPICLELLLPYLKKRSQKLVSISVLTDRFDTDKLSQFAPYTEEFRLVLALPEVGAMAEAAFAEEPLFEPTENSLLIHADSLVVTKLKLMTTPIIKYRTNILTKKEPDGDKFSLI